MIDLSGRDRGSHSAYLGVAWKTLAEDLLGGDRMRNKRPYETGELDCSVIDVSEQRTGGKTFGGDGMIK